MSAAATHDNPFTLPKTEYKRDLNLVGNYIKDSAHYLHTMTGKPLDECIEYVRRNLKPGGRFEIKDPQVRYLERGENGDRVEKMGSFLGYLGDSVKKRELIAPTFTTYTHPSVKKSILAEFIGINVKARSVAKKAMYRAEMAGDTVTYLFKKNEQNNRKLANNAISGAHVSNSTPLFNRTSHSTLTSNCRTTSGYGNANNEKMLSGNRHYHNHLIVINNLVSITNHTNYDELAEVMRKYGIRTVTHEEVMGLIQFSTDLYWRSEQHMTLIRDLVYKLNPMQLSAFAYTGDLYHLMRFNDAVMRKFLGQLSMKVTGSTIENPGETIEKYREEYLLLAMQLFPLEMRGKTMKDIKGTQQEKDIAATVENIHNTLTAHADLIKVILRTTNVPASLGFFPDSIRRAALTSDTDSTIFTVQDWVFWYYGESPGFTEGTSGLAATMIFLAAESITHVLAMMSANFGIESERIHQVAMKNEYKFDVFVPTQVGKHYFAYISCQEGNVYAKYKMEIKGVHLKSSNVPKKVTKQAEDMMKRIMETVLENKKISLVQYLNEVADLEKDVQRSIIAGESTYMRSGQIKTAESYKKDPQSSPYQFYDLWQKVFAPKYGDAPPPPYQAMKLSLDMQNASAVRKWVESIEDKALAERLRNWLTANNKSGAITSLLLPEQNLEANGMPKELISQLDMRRATLDVSKIFYLILETLGYYATNEKLSHLCCDYYGSRTAEGEGDFSFPDNVNMNH